MYLSALSMDKRNNKGLFICTDSSLIKNPGSILAPTDSADVGNRLINPFVCP